MAFITINNRSNILLKEVPSYHPDSVEYETFWAEQAKRLVLGYWFPDDSTHTWNVETSTAQHNKYKGKSWRFCPPALYFYGNYGTIKHKPKGAAKTQAKVKMRPLIRDVEWEIYYDVLQARGFSGFELDNEYTCQEECIEQGFGYKDKETGEISLEPLNSNYYKVQYINPFIYLRQLFTVPVGNPVYNNGAKNYMVLASRGIGKSYSFSGIGGHELLIDGRKALGGETPICEMFVGSGIASKSLDLMKKIKDQITELPGKWKPNTNEYLPSPLSKEMTGSINPGFKWTHEYDVKVAGKWVKKGSGSNITHGVFTTENPEAAAGGRYTIIFIEEVGLTPNAEALTLSNDAAQADDTWQMGSTLYIGTGGNIEKIQDAEKLFRNPQEYNMLEFEDVWEGTGKIGRFIPAIYRLNEYKDKNGNTDVEKATAFYNKRRDKFRKGSSALYGEMMNYPLKPSEMFLAKGGERFPVEDLRNIYSELLSNESIRAASWKVELFLEAGKVVAKPSNKPVITEYPYNILNDTDCAIEIFSHPKYKETEINGTYIKKITSGRYIAATDPTDKDGKEKDNSLQSTWIFDTWSDTIVAEYTARPALAKHYYEQVRRLLIYYNALNLYENNWKGLHQYFDNKNSTHLLAKTPEFLIEKEMIKYTQVGNNAFGIRMGGGNGRATGLKEYGLQLLEAWLVEKNATYSTEEKEIRNMDTIRSLAFLLELIKYNPEANLDRLSAFIILMIYRESLINITNTSRYNTKKYKKATDDPFWSRAY